MMPLLAGDPPHDAACRVPVETATTPREKDWTFAALANREIDGPGGARGEGDRDDLPALPQDHERAVAAVEAKVFDVGTERFGNTQAVQRKQAKQRVVSRTPARPAATSIAPTSLRSSPTVCDS